MVSTSEEIFSKLFKDHKFDSFITIKLLLLAYYPCSHLFSPFDQATEQFLDNPKELFKVIIKFYEEKVFPQYKFAHFWDTLAISYLGITSENLSRILDLDKEEITELLKMFDSLLLKLPDGRIRILNHCLQEAVCELYLPSSEKLLKHHKTIAMVLLNEAKYSPENVILL